MYSGGAAMTIHQFGAGQKTKTLGIEAFAKGSAVLRSLDVWGMGNMWAKMQ